MMIGSAGLHMQSAQLATGASRHLRTQNTDQDQASQTSSVEKEDKKQESRNGLTQEELQQIQQLKARDREVRAHEAAHAAVGGQYAGAANFTYERGPDGQSYAIGGEVSISVSPESNPEATIRKMEVVIRAALAPAEPSSQDRQVARSAQATKMQAQAELADQLKEETKKTDKSKAEVDESSENTDTPNKTSGQVKTEQLFDTSPVKPANFSTQA